MIIRLHKCTNDRGCFMQLADVLLTRSHMKGPWHTYDLDALRLRRAYLGDAPGFISLTRRQSNGLAHRVRLPSAST